MNRVCWQGKGILLRRFTIDDAGEFLKIANDMYVKQYVPGAFCQNRKEAKELMKDYSNYDCQNDFYLAICELLTGKLIGAILSYRVPGTCCLEIAYFIGKGYRHQGYMRTALSLFLDEIKKLSSFESVSFLVSPTNTSSMAIMKWLGAKSSGNGLFFKDL